MSSSSFCQAEGRGDSGFVAFQHAPPAQIVLQVFGGHTVKATHPAFEPTVVGVDVLDVEDAVDDAWAVLDIERSDRPAVGAPPSRVRHRVFPV